MSSTYSESFQSPARSNHRFLPVKSFSAVGQSHSVHTSVGLDRLIGSSQIMQDLRKSIRNVAKSSETVLITGESGTGKELIARAIHDLSRRQNQPFLAINCGSLTESLLESELFGHVKGAFTGATASKKGFFEAATGGTIFLDEFGEMSLSTQQRLLRVLQEGSVRPVGSTDPKEIEIDARVVVATNHDLERDVFEGKFRKDLYYRVNVLEIRAPALRERLEDVLPLTQHFIRKHNAKNADHVSEGISANVHSMLKSHSWPGNVRELENIIKRLAMRVSDKGMITEGDAKSIRELNPIASTEARLHEDSVGRRAGSTGLRCLPAVGKSQHRCACCEELELYRRHMDETGGNLAKAARRLRIPRSTLQRRLNKLQDTCASLTS